MRSTSEATVSGRAERWFSTRAGTDDLFMAGETVRGAADITGSAHLAGRKVTMAGAVGGDAYLAGMDVTLEGQVAGDATLAGYDVRVGASAAICGFPAPSWLSKDLLRVMH